MSRGRLGGVDIKFLKSYIVEKKKSYIVDSIGRQIETQQKEIFSNSELSPSGSRQTGTLHCPTYLVLRKGINCSPSSIPEEETMTTPPLGFRESWCCFVEGRRGSAGKSRPGTLCLLSQMSFSLTAWICCGQIPPSADLDVLHRAGPRAG